MIREATREPSPSAFDESTNQMRTRNNETLAETNRTKIIEMWDGNI